MRAGTCGERDQATNKGAIGLLDGGREEAIKPLRALRVVPPAMGQSANKHENGQIASQSPQRQNLLEINVSMRFIRFIHAVQGK